MNREIVSFRIRSRTGMILRASACFAFLVSVSCSRLSKLSGNVGCETETIIALEAPYLNNAIESTFPAHRDRVMIDDMPGHPQGPGDPGERLVYINFARNVDIDTESGVDLCNTGSCKRTHIVSCPVSVASCTEHQVDWNGIDAVLDFESDPPESLPFSTDLFAFQLILPDGTVQEGGAPQAVLALNESYLNLSMASRGGCVDVFVFLRGNGAGLFPNGKTFSSASAPLKVVDGGPVGPMAFTFTICERTGPPPEVSRITFRDFDGQQKALSAGVPPHAPISIEFSRPMAWATPPLDNLGRRILYQDNREFMDGESVLRIIPRDGKGFDPDSTHFLNVLGRESESGGFLPTPTVSLDGQSIQEDEIHNFHTRESRILSIGDHDTFSNLDPLLLAVTLPMDLRTENGAGLVAAVKPLDKLVSLESVVVSGGHGGTVCGDPVAIIRSEPNFTLDEHGSLHPFFQYPGENLVAIGPIVKKEICVPPRETRQVIDTISIDDYVRVNIDPVLEDFVLFFPFGEIRDKLLQTTVFESNESFLPISIVNPAPEISAETHFSAEFPLIEFKPGNEPSGGEGWPGSFIIRRLRFFLDPSKAAVEYSPQTGNLRVKLFASTIKVVDGEFSCFHNHHICREDKSCNIAENTRVTIDFTPRIVENHFEVAVGSTVNIEEINPPDCPDFVAKPFEGFVQRKLSENINEIQDKVINRLAFVLSPVLAEGVLRTALGGLPEEGGLTAEDLRKVYWTLYPIDLGDFAARIKLEDDHPRHIELGDVLTGGGGVNLQLRRATGSQALVGQVPIPETYTCSVRSIWAESFQVKCLNREVNGQRCSFLSVAEQPDSSGPHSLFVGDYLQYTIKARRNIFASRMADLGRESPGSNERDLILNGSNTMRPEDVENWVGAFCDVP